MNISDANFYDGKISLKRNAMIEILGSFLIINIEGDARTYRWNLENVEILEKPIDNQPALIGCSDMPDARLIINQIDDFKKISQYIKQPSWWQTSGVFVRNIAALMITLCIIVIFAIPYWSKLIVPLVPATWESKLGEQAKSIIIGDSKICNSKKGNKALDKILVNLIDYKSNYNYNISVIKKNTSNAISLPGGNIIIFSKLIDQADSQDELIAVIAHEIAHIKYQHGLESAINTLTAGFIIDVFTGGGGTILYLANQYKSLSFSREKEREADKYAIKLLENKNIDINGMINFFNKTNKTQKQNHFSDIIPDYLSTHPNSKERIDSIEKQRTKSKRNYSSLISNEEWKNIKRICN